MGDSFQYIASNRVRFHQELHLRPRRISHYRFLYVESGSGEYRIAEESFQVAAGWLGLLAPGVRENRYFGREPVSYLFVEFQAASRLTEQRAVPFPGQEPQRSALVGLLKTIQAEQADAEGCLLAAAVRLMFPEADRGTQRRLRIKIIGSAIWQRPRGFRNRICGGCFASRWGRVRNSF